MKTKGLSNLIMMSLVLSTFTACQEEEFYEKEYIDGAIEQYEREHNTVEEDDLAEQINDEDLDPEDRINPDDDDSNNDDDDDGDSDNDDGVADNDDSNNNDDDDDGDSDNDDGVADNDDSNNNDDDDDGDSDNDDGVADNDDSNNDDDDDGDSDNDDGIADNDDDNDNDVTLESNSDSFGQSGKNAPIDILWVVDNSGSMADEQQALADNFSAFIKDFAEKDIDFQMAITTTDRNRGVLTPTPMEKANMAKLTKSAMDANKDKFIKDFQDLIKVGVKGYGIEKGLKSSEVFTDVYANHFLRDNAYLIIVYVTDERDQSEKTVSEHLKQIQKWKNNDGLVKTYSIVDMDNLVSTKYILKGYDRYKEMSDLTGGYVANLYDDFHTVFSNMGVSIASLADQFPLSKVPYTTDSIKVTVNGIETVEWDYSANTNTIQFHANAIPADGSSIEVTYDVKK